MKCVDVPRPRRICAGPIHHAEFTKFTEFTTGGDAVFSQPRIVADANIV